MKTNHYLQKGFTLIELMVVICIIGILSYIAFPAYQLYITRVKLVETMRFSDAVKTLIWEAYTTRAVMPDQDTPASLETINIMQSSKYINNATYTKIDNNNVSLAVTFQNIGSGTDGNTMIFSFKVDPQTITMDCLGGTLPNQYRPTICRS